MEGRLNRKVRVFIAAAMVAVTVGCDRSAQRGDSTRDLTLLRLGYRPKALADITPVIIEELKLAKGNIRVQLVPVPTPPVALQKLSAGEVDAVAGIPLAAILAELEVGDPGFLAYWHQVDRAGEGWVSLVGNSALGVKDIKDLAGLPAAALPTEQAQWLLRRILVASGIAQDQVKVVVYNPMTPLAGMEAKEHACIFGLEPAISEAVVRGNVILAKGPVSKYLYDGKPVIVSASLISTKFVREHPEAYRAFRKVVAEAVRVTEFRPDEVRALFTKRDYGELSREVASRLFFPVMVEPSPEIRLTTEKFVEDLVQDGLLKSRVNLDALFPNNTDSGG